jgi:hypothetical protein
MASSCPGSGSTASRRGRPLPVKGLTEPAPLRAISAVSGECFVRRLPVSPFLARPVCGSGWASVHAGTLAGHDCADLFVGYPSRTGHAVNPTQGHNPVLPRAASNACRPAASLGAASRKASGMLKCAADISCALPLSDVHCRRHDLLPRSERPSEAEVVVVDTLEPLLAGSAPLRAAPQSLPIKNHAGGMGANFRHQSTSAPVIQVPDGSDLQTAR